MGRRSPVAGHRSRGCRPPASGSRSFAPGALHFGLMVFVLAALLGACGSRRQGQPSDRLDTVEVKPAPEASLEVKDDVKAPERGTTGLTGVVPADFPSDVPLYSPASITDFGQTAGGRRQLTFTTPAGPDKVRAWLTSKLPARGWSEVPGASGDTLRYEKGQRTVSITVRRDPVGAVYRIEY